MAVRILLAAALFAGLALPTSADFADGLRAFDGGDYRAAYREWADLAAAGDADAQVALAGLYRSGLGVPQDGSRAADWYRRAAEQGHGIAQLNLGEMYLTGRGVRRDRIQAYLWLSLAAAQGYAWAAERKELVAARMAREELAEAERLAREWQPCAR
ncbi:MAG: tetratricopeptide repeat protein [Alphaproteobacteria bacterium]